LDGPRSDRGEPLVNLAGYIIHSCIHGARDDVQCVLHTHSRAVMAVACLDQGLIPMEQEGLQFYNRVAYHDYEGLSVDADEKSRLIADLGQKNVMLMRNHGAVTVGATISEAFRRMYYLDSACRVQLDVLHTGGKIRLPSPEVCEHTARQWEAGTASIGGGAEPTLEWEAMKRLMDRKDPSYRE
ncbi:MAG: class II aldolase/adducin family protein, partial [Bauldia litoralis]